MLHYRTWKYVVVCESVLYCSLYCIYHYLYCIMLLSILTILCYCVVWYYTRLICFPCIVVFSMYYIVRIAETYIDMYTHTSLRLFYLSFVPLLSPLQDHCQDVVVLQNSSEVGRTLYGLRGISCESYSLVGHLIQEISWALAWPCFEWSLRVSAWSKLDCLIRMVGSLSVCKAKKIDWTAMLSKFWIPNWFWEFKVDHLSSEQDMTFSYVQLKMSARLV